MIILTVITISGAPCFCKCTFRILYLKIRTSTIYYIWKYALLQYIIFENTYFYNILYLKIRTSTIYYIWKYVLLQYIKFENTYMNNILYLKILQYIILEIYFVFWFQNCIKHQNWMKIDKVVSFDKLGFTILMFHTILESGDKTNHNGDKFKTIRPSQIVTWGFLEVLFIFR
jgi:hypothetical protein